MSENGNSIGGAPQFTERELQMLGWAMQSLKSGPPEIDYDKLATYAGMTNPGSARNAWAKIRVKLIQDPDGTVPKPPTPRKRAPKKQDVDGESSPKKKPTRGKKVSDDEAVKSEENEDVKMKTDPDEALNGTIEEA
ncbi:hypothetical protein PTNB73_05790 [Pyrenophora teres f. teres]|nr:hypothetical protein HRS9139_06865 [Pyrenophora teres f. teres]KAE8864902.1 hypothetical protein PTNB73_05790 [Pyrenophora teres f. teres]